MKGEISAASFRLVTVHIIPTLFDKNMKPHVKDRHGISLYT
jgi:hypothetical protein